MAPYFAILLFTGIALALATIMQAIPWLTNRPNLTKAKTEAYESGFEAFDTARRTFDVRF